jgi:ABC-type sulfate transport system permease component
LVVLLLFFLAVALLVRSMNKHLRRVPESFEDDSATPPGAE